MNLFFNRTLRTVSPIFMKHCLKIVKFVDKREDVYLINYYYVVYMINYLSQVYRVYSPELANSLLLNIFMTIEKKNKDHPNKINDLISRNNLFVSLADKLNLNDYESELIGFADFLLSFIDNSDRSFQNQMSVASLFADYLDEANAALH